jgi:hypothetical protein
LPSVSEFCLNLSAEQETSAGELRINVSSSPVSTSAVIQNAAQDARALDSGISNADAAAQATAPLISLMDSEADPWKLLLERLGVLDRIMSTITQASLRLHPYCSDQLI